MAEITEFENHRSYLFAIAYRMLGSVSDAEDMIQEAFVRWEQRDSSQEVRSPRSYLSTIVTRLCVEHLRKAYVRREEYVGPWLPEPLVANVVESAEDKSELADSLSIAFLVIMESLSPVERAVFLLREVFDYDYKEIANIVGKTDTNCRQIARRAQQHVEDKRPRYSPTEEEKFEVMGHFAQSCQNGDLASLVSYLADDVVFYSDGGGKAKAAINPIYGSDKVGRFIIGVLGKTPEEAIALPMLVNAQPGIVLFLDGHAKSAATFEIAHGKIQNIFSIVNPDKLTGIVM